MEEKGIMTEQAEVIKSLKDMLSWIKSYYPSLLTEDLERAIDHIADLERQLAEKDFEKRLALVDMELSREEARALCDSIEIYSDFFDVDNEEYIMLKENNPVLLGAYEVIFTIANADE